jgi:hypothetical protein
MLLKRAKRDLKSEKMIATSRLEILYGSMSIQKEIIQGDIGRIDYILRSEEAKGLEKGYVIFSTDSLPSREK